MSKTKDLFKEIKEMTGSSISSCSAVKLSTRRLVSEEKNLKIDGNNIQKIYTEKIPI